MAAMNEGALRMVFSIFDVDKSGGISLEELQSAVKVLGIQNCPPSKVAQMFADADDDKSGEIDFEEFCGVIDKGDGGALARIIQKVVEDKAIRDIMRERCRPTPGAGKLSEQLEKVRAERQWMSNLQMISAHDIVEARKMGYASDSSTFVGNAHEAHVPRVTDGVLSPDRAARRMMPALGEETAALVAPAALRPGLRRLFNSHSASPGESPVTQRRRLGMQNQLSPLRGGRRAAGGAGLAVSHSLGSLGSLGGRGRFALDPAWDTSRASRDISQPHKRMAGQISFHDNHVEPLVGVP